MQTLGTTKDSLFTDALSQILALFDLCLAAITLDMKKLIFT